MAKSRLIVYWVTTAVLAFVLLSGGIANLMQQAQTIAGMRRLGYPDYVASILGFWKILGGITILAPGLPRAKEWAYAGIFFDFTGAAASHAFSRDYGAGAFHIIVPLVLVVILSISWWLRPASRRIV
jgi:uncharacterized membrane protein YphA (DoxX/SURF4 family)